MNFFRPIKPLLKGWLLSFVGYGFVAFVMSAQFVSGGSSGIGVAVRSSLRDFLPWVVVTPLLFRFAARFPIGLQRSASRFGAHLGVCVAVIALCHWWTGTIDPGFRAGPGGPPSHAERPPPPPWKGDSDSSKRPLPPPRREGPETNRAPLQEVRALAARHKLDLVHIGTFQLPLYLMVMCAAHASLFYRRDRERETSLVRARLSVLTTQLQPHFLFNTLNVIAELVHEDPHKADAMITALSEMLRLTLDANASELVPLEQEAQFIERYFAIMQTRFGERLQYECEITPAARAGLVPPFLLQPLVENAIKHGLGPTPNGGTVTIYADVIDRALHVSVSDNGVGMPGGVPEREGLGLRNTRERLRQLFGEQSSVTITNSRGTEVEVILPYASA